jgi:hypothetical protein
LRPAEAVVNVLDRPASCGDFLAGQAFTDDDVYVGSHLRFDLSNRWKQRAAEQDVQLVSPRNTERTERGAPVGVDPNRPFDLTLPGARTGLPHDLPAIALKYALLSDKRRQRCAPMRQSNMFQRLGSVYWRF